MQQQTLPMILAAAWILFATPERTEAKPEFGPMVDQFCSNNMRIPPTPFADLKGDMPLQECQLCHQPGTFNKQDTLEPNFSEFKNARGNGDFRFFCPELVLANAPPVLTFIGTKTIKQQALLQIALTANDPDNNRLSFSVSGEPAGSAFMDNGDGTALFSWTPGLEQSGNYSLTFTVQDDGVPPLSDFESILIAVVAPNDAPNRPPLLLGIGEKMGRVGETLSFSVRSTDPDGDSITLQAGPPLPMGAAFIQTEDTPGNATGVFTWTPGMTQAGSHAVAFTSLDDGNPAGSDSESVSISIQAEAPPNEVPLPPTPVPPNTSDLRITEAEWKAKRGRLDVKGKGAGDYRRVDIINAENGALIGSGSSNEEGEFKMRLRPLPVPCAVQARVEDAVGPAMELEDPPVVCRGGDARAIRLKKAEWKREKRQLRVEGDRAPMGATVDIYDAELDSLIASVTVRRGGKFRYRGRIAAPPCNLVVAIDGVALATTTVRQGPCDVHRELEDEDEDRDEEEDEDEDEEDDD